MFTGSFRKWIISNATSDCSKKMENQALPNYSNAYFLKRLPAPSRGFRFKKLVQSKHKRWQKFCSIININKAICVKRIAFAKQFEVVKTTFANLKSLIQTLYKAIATVIKNILFQ